MAEGIVQVTEGTGKKLHTWQRTIGANNVEDEFTLNGEFPLASYVVVPGATSTTATINSHMAQIMAGASLNVYVRRIRVYQLAIAAAATIGQMVLVRLTTAGTGGTVGTQGAYDSTDSAAGATSMTLPTVKGTEGTVLWSGTMGVLGLAPASGGEAVKILDMDFDRLRHKALRIPAGAANGLAVKNSFALAAATFLIDIDFVEANF